MTPNRADVLTERQAPALADARWFAPAVLTLAAIAAAIPILIAAVPPVMDFPNHLARIWLIAGGIHEKPLSSFYEVRWSQAFTNVAVDFLGVALVRACGLAAAAKVLLAAMLLGPPLAAAVLNRSLFGRASLWQLAGITLVWCTTAVEGFLSFQIGIAAGLFCAVALRRTIARPSPRSLGLAALCAAALLSVHPFAVAMLLATLAGLALGERMTWTWDFLRRRGASVLMLTAACALPVAALYVLAPHPPGAYNGEAQLVHFNPVSETLRPKNLALLYASPFLSYRVAWDLVAALPVFGLAAWAAIVRALRFHAGLLAVAAAMALVAVFLPTNIGDGGALPVRFPIMAALLAVAGTSIEFRTPPARLVFAVVLTAAAIFRVGSIAWIWNARAGDVQQLRTAARSIPVGASVMVLQQKWDGEAPIGRLITACPGGECAAERHFGALTVIWRHVFVPVLFTVPGQHPIAVRPPWDKNAVYASFIPFTDELAPGEYGDRYLLHWWKRFDYVLVLDADLGGTPIPHARLVRDSGFARVYRVVPGS